MMLQPVVERIDIQVAAQFHGIPDIEMCQLVAGRCEPSEAGDGWDLIFENDKVRHILHKGDWLVKSKDGVYHKVRESVFGAAFAKVEEDE